MLNNRNSAGPFPTSGRRAVAITGRRDPAGPGLPPQLRRARLVAIAIMLSGACVPDWDAYDPRLGRSSDIGSGGGTGGISPICAPGAVTACYSGPPGTDGLGVCTSGTKTCEEDGMSYGPCVGEVTPSAETCEASGDEDCDGQVNEEGAGCVCAPGSAVECYSGPPGTEDVGLCTGGTRACNADGSSYGPCMDEVTPVAESCETAGDDDCDGEKNDHCALWSRRFGATGDQRARDVAVDSDDAIVLTGRFLNEIDFGGGVLVSEGDNDGFLAKLDPTGAHIWSRRFGDGGFQQAVSVAVDGTGNVIVVGSFEGTIALGGAADPQHTSAGGEDAFVAKYSPTGAYLWSRAFGGADDQAANAVATDLLDNVIVIGTFSGAIDVGGPAPLTAVDGSDGFVVKLDPQGDHVWSKAFGGMYDDAGTAVATDTSSDVFVAGWFDESISFGDEPLTDQGNLDAFVAKLTPNGDPMWAKAFGGAQFQEAYSLAVDGAGDVIVSGEFEGTINFGGQDLSSAGADDIFVAKLSGEGAHIWSMAFGDAADQQPGDVAVDGAGDVLITGALVGSTACGDVKLTSAGSFDTFVLKLSGGSGGCLWGRRFGDSGAQDGRAVAADSKSNGVVTGAVSGKINFGAGDLASAGAADVYLAKLLP